MASAAHVRSCVTNGCQDRTPSLDRLRVDGIAPSNAVDLVEELAACWAAVLLDLIRPSEIRKQPESRHLLQLIRVQKHHHLRGCPT